MSLRVFVLVVVWPVVEIAVAVQVAHAAGWGPVILAQAVLSLLGVLVLRSAGRHSRRTWRQMAAGGPMPSAGVAGDTGLRFLAGLLLFVPGFVSDAVGLLLVVAPVRAVVLALVGTAVARRADRWMVMAQRTHMAGGDVIRGEVVREDRPPEAHPPPALPGPDGP